MGTKTLCSLAFGLVEVKIENLNNRHKAKEVELGW